MQSLRMAEGIHSRPSVTGLREEGSTWISLSRRFVAHLVQRRIDDYASASGRPMILAGESLALSSEDVACALVSEIKSDCDRADRVPAFIRNVRFVMRFHCLSLFDEFSG